MQDCGKEFCPEHSDNTAKINKHSGMWSILIAFGAILIVFSWAQHEGQKNIAASVVEIKVAIASSIASNDEAINGIRERIMRVEDHAEGLEHRIRSLEIVGD